MGVPIGRLICASNSNNVLTDFLCTGVYDRNRTFYNTMSPSMDILISSNLERLLFSLSNHDDAEVRGYMEELARSGRYEVSPAIKAGWRSFSPPVSATTLRHRRSSAACGRSTAT